MEEWRQLRCLIAAGGTAGHVLPALAVAEALTERGVAVTFAGSPDRVEAELVPAAGYQLDAFRVTGLPRRPSPALARALLLACRAPVACRAILRRRRPDVVLGGGGFVAGPMVFAASTMRIPTALTEADAHLGLANRLALPFARRVFLAYPLARRTGSRFRVVGRPLPETSRPVPRDEARRLFDFDPDAKVLGIFGALAGAKALNDFVVDTWGARGPAILHLTGERDFEDVRARVEREDYRVLSSVDGLGAALSACDLALARAGGTVWEIAAAGVPAIFVPYPYATADHQARNAEHFVRAGGAVLMREAQLADVPALVDELLADDERRAAMADAMRAAARPNAASEIADGLLELVGARRG